MEVHFREGHPTLSTLNVKRITEGPYGEIILYRERAGHQPEEISVFLSDIERIKIGDVSFFLVKRIDIAGISFVPEKK